MFIWLQECFDYLVSEWPKKLSTCIIVFHKFQIYFSEVPNKSKMRFPSLLYHGQTYSYSIIFYKHKMLAFMPILYSHIYVVFFLILYQLVELRTNWFSVAKLKWSWQCWHSCLVENLWINSVDLFIMNQHWLRKDTHYVLHTWTVTSLVRVWCH